MTNRKATHQQNSVLNGVKETMPELQKSVKLTQQAALIGFDWPTIDPVFAKMQEELQELKEAIATGDREKIKDELGDVLFVCTNLARHLHQDPQQALKHANQKFERRFRAVESAAKQQKPQLSQYELDFLDNLWDKVKILE